MPRRPYAAKKSTFRSDNPKMDSSRMQRVPKGYKDGGIVEREPYPGEAEYFRNNPDVAGMASEDDAVVINPYSDLSEQELDAVRMNERARIVMRRQGAPTFSLTPEQRRFLDSNTYRQASEADRRATIAARILSGDPSAGTPTPEQIEYVNRLRAIMGDR